MMFVRYFVVPCKLIASFKLKGGIFEINSDGVVMQSRSPPTPPFTPVVKGEEEVDNECFGEEMELLFLLLRNEGIRRKRDDAAPVVGVVMDEVNDEEEVFNFLDSDLVVCVWLLLWLLLLLLPFLCLTMVSDSVGMLVRIK